MRWTEILNESVAKYRPMFNMFAVDGKLPDWVDNLIRKIEDLFKREDRVVWALRWARFHAYLKTFNKTSTYDRQVFLDSPITKKLIHDLSDTPLSLEDAMFQAIQFDDDFSDFAHILSLPIHKIQ